MNPWLKYYDNAQSETSPKLQNPRNPWLKYYDDAPDAQPESKSDDDSPLDAITRLLRPGGVAVELAKGSLPDFLIGSFLETAGNATRGTLAETYSPGLKSVNDSLHEAADSFLEDASKRLTVDDYDTFGGAGKNSFGSQGYGSLGGLMSFLGSDKSANALMNASAALENRNRVSTDDGYWNYFTNPRGFWSDFWGLGGSMAMIAPTMALFPEGAALGGLTRVLGGTAIERFLINQGLGKFLAQSAPNIVRYAATSAPTEAAMEGGQARYDALRAGLSPEEADRRKWEVFKYNLPLLGGSNAFEAALMFSPLSSKLKPLLGRFGRLSTPMQIGGRGLLGSLQQQFEEANQQGIQDFVAGKDFGILPWNWTDEQLDAAERVRYPGALMGLLGGGFHALSEDEMSDDEYSARADDVLEAKARRDTRGAITQRDYADLKALRSWADKHSGGVMSDEVFGSIVRAAQQEGVPVDRLLAQAIQESNGNQKAISEAGAIGVMQLMPETAQELGVNPHDTEQNIIGGARYLKQQYDATGNWDLAHAAYNAGLGAVQKYGGIPRYGETQDYVSRINDYLSDRPDVGNISRYMPEDPKTHYLGSNGAGEGKTWIRQTDAVSFDGAHSQFLNAVDILADWFYKRTGKRLVVTSGTNGSHADGEHSHAAGWKVDVNDWENGTSDGYLVRAEGGKGSLTDEFIAFGRSLGLGMNWEDDHIDVALDGTQWDGNGRNAGGFNPRYPTTSKRTTDSGETPTPPPIETPESPETPPVKVEDEKPPAPPESPTTPETKADDEKLFEEFSNEKFNPRDGNADPDDLDFFEPMFDDFGNFDNTQENRDAIRRFYGREFRNWEQDYIDNHSPAPQAQSTPKPTSPNQNPPQIQATSNQPQRQAQPIQPPAQTSPTAQVSTPAPQQTQPPQPQATKDPVSQDTPPQQNQPTTKINGTDGNSAQVLTDNRNRYGVRYKVVEADDLNVSHELEPVTSDVIQNKNYPAELQPRDRERAGYRDRVLNMGANLDPTQLMDSENVNQGAPVIRSDGVVLNGNGRAMAIRRAQAMGNAEGYRNAILENAERLGLNKDEIAAMKNPVLVREVTDNLSGDALTNITQSRQGGMQLGAVEQAREDAKKLTSQILSRAPADGDLTKAGSRQFLIDSLRAISSPEELNAMTSANGGVTDAGVRRVRHALFAAAFGDNQTLANLAETSETEGNAVKGATNALTATAAKFARIRAASEQGNLPKVDFSPIIQAVERLAALRNQGTPILKHLAQTTLKGFETESAEVKDLLGFFDGHKHNPKEITAFMNALADGILAKASNSGELFGGAPKSISLAKAIANARQQVEGNDFTQVELQHEPIFKEISERMHKRLQTRKDKYLKAFVNSILENAKNGDEESLRILNRLKGKPTETNMFNMTEENSDETSQQTAPEKSTGTQENSNQDAESQQAPPQVKSYPKGSKGDRLHRKLKTDTHPALRARVDSLLEKAAKGDTDAQNQVDDLLKNKYSDEQLDAWENSLNPQRQATDADPKVETDAAPESETSPKAEDESKAEPETKPAEEKRAESESTPEVKAESKAKLSRVGDQGTLENVLSDDELTPVQKAIRDFCAKLGVPVKFFRSHSDAQGAFRDGVAYINVNSKATPEWVFHHELGHWLAANNPQLFNQLVKLLNITDAQRQAYRDKFKRHDLSDDEVDAEILCDMLGDEAQRLGLLKDANKKNPSLVGRLIAWMKNLLDKFTDFMFKPENGLTRSQRNRLYDSVGRLANAIVDAHGNKKYRYNRETHTLEYADGTPIETLPITKANEKSGTKFSRSETKNAAFDGAFTSDGRLTNPWKARQAIKEQLSPLKGVPITNRATGIVAQFGKEAIGKLVSDKALRKSVTNGFSERQHFEAAANIKQLFEDAELAEQRPDRDNDPNIKDIKYFNCDTTVAGEKAVARIMVKDTVQHGHHIYTIELQELNKPAELQNQAVNDSSAGSKGSTLKSRQDSTTVAEEPSGESITQEFDENNPKTRRDTPAGKFFMQAVDKFQRALHLKGDRIISSEDQRQAKKAAAKSALEAYIKNPSKENLKRLHELGLTIEHVKKYRNDNLFDDGIGILQYLGLSPSNSSPSRIADKVQIFRRFFRMGDRALRKQIQSRGKYVRRYNRIMDIVAKKEDRENLFGLLWKGDFDKKEFGKLSDEEFKKVTGYTREEAKNEEVSKKIKSEAIQRAQVEKICREQDVSENVARAYLEVRKMLRALGTEINKARRHPQTQSRFLSDAEIEKLKGNKFVEIKQIGDKRDESGKRKVRYTEFENRERAEAVTPETLKKLEKDDAIQILDQSGFNGGVALVRFREGIPEFSKIPGYIPHFFHEYSVEVRDKTGKKVGKTLFTAQTERDAVKLAEEWKKSNTLKDGENLYITPRGLARELGLDAEKLAPVVGDNDFEKMTRRISKLHDMTLEEAKKFLEDATQFKKRHRFLGALIDRKGAEGFEQNMDWVLRHYINIGTRYVAMESEFLPQAITQFEKLFGAFDNDYSRNLTAQYVKEYIQDVNGNPTRVEEIMNKALNKAEFYRKWVTATYGNRGWLTATDATIRFVSYMKLGFFNLSSAMLNLTQLINAGGLLGGYGRLGKHFGKIVAQGGKLTHEQLRILTESGVINDLGLESNSETAPARFSRQGNFLERIFKILNSDADKFAKGDALLNETMVIFQTMDTLCRAATTLAAYEQATSQGKSKSDALEYAADVNRKANFDYSVTDAPNLFRRFGPIGKLVLQFQKYPVKQLELLWDMHPLNSKTSRAQKIAFWFPYIFVCGLMGFMPFFDWGDKIANKFGFFPKDFLEECVIKGSQKYLPEAISKDVSRAVLYGGGALANVDMSSRAGLAGFLDNDLKGATLSTISNFAGDMWDGEYSRALRDISPGLYNYYAALEGETKGRRGRTNDVYDFWGRLRRAFGFRSADEAAIVDAERIERNTQKQKIDDRHKAIDAYIDDPSQKNGERCAELGITYKDIQREMRKKELTREGRFWDNVPKKDRPDYQYLEDFVDDDD